MRTRPRLLSALAVVAVSVAALAAPGVRLTAAEGDLPPGVRADLQILLNSAVRAAMIPGAAVLIDAPGVTFAGASGYADLANHTPLRADDAFRVGSITKMFTATVILQLAEEGALGLDDRLADWLPEIAATLPYGDQITLRQMLNHTAGLYDYTDDPLTLERVRADPYRHTDPHTIIACVTEINEANFAPGEGWSYCNTGYILLGLIIEQITGGPVAEALRARIFEPVGMEDTYLDEEEWPRARLVRGYLRYSGQWVDVTDWNVSTAWTAGALVSSPPDLAAFVRALFGGDLFAGDATLAAMLDMDASQGAPYALGIMPMGPPGSWGHGGSIWGYLAQLIYVPGDDLVVVALVNNSARGIQIARLMDRVLPYVAGE